MTRSTNHTLFSCPACGAALVAEAPQGLCPACLMRQAMEPTEGSGGVAGGRSRVPSWDEVAASFPQLEVLELIGQGGMGAVFRARQPNLGRLVALKVIPVGAGGDAAAFAERFEREGRLLARLHHPNIVTIFDSGRAGDFFFLLMEHVDGVNLRQAMQVGRFTPTQALGIVPKICDALQYAHEEGVLHRDIKPENILLDAKGRVKLVDFGIAKLAAEAETGVATVAEGGAAAGLTEAGMALGTPRYMAPEQAADPQSVDHRADIYSLGVVFYELLTGELPPGGVVRPSERTAVDQRVDAIVGQALERERNLRQRSAEEMKTQIEAVEGSVRPASGRDGKRGVLSWVNRLAKAAVLAVGLALLLRAFVVQAFVAKGNSAAPELPDGSWVVVWKLPTKIAPGDFIVYEQGERSWLGRVVAVREGELQVRRFGKDDQVVPRGVVTGKVIAQTRAARGAGGKDGREAPALLERESAALLLQEGSAPAPGIVPMADWIQGTWAFDAEHSREMARVADSATTEESRLAAQQALEQLRATLGRGTEEMRWTITATEMQSNHAAEGNRSGPYQILESRGPYELVVRSFDQGIAKGVLIRREGERMRMTEEPPPPSPYHLELPGYYRRVPPSETSEPTE